MIKIILCQVPLSQGLQAVKLKQNPGILPVKQGHAFLQKDKWSIIKTSNLKGIVTDLNYNIDKYLQFNDIINQNRSYINEVLELKTQVEYLRDETLNKIRQLIPSKRYKRGLINPLGSIIKIITGNLDHDDAMRYDSIINGLKTREQGISNKIIIISEMMDHFLNSTQTINDNTKVMNERLQRIENIVTDLSKENMYVFVSYLSNVLNMFIVNFRTIYIKINDLETALALSKVSILHKSVFDSKELLDVLCEVSKYDNLMYSVTEQNLINIEETFSVKAYLKGEEIRFIIDVPLVFNNTYNYFKLYPLPISRDSETFAIIPEFPFLLVDGTKYRPTARQCREITADEYLCSEDDLVPYAPETCIEQLMEYRQNLSRCFPRRVLSEDLKLQKLGSNSWIMYCKIDKILTQTCDDDVTRETVRGTYLLTIPETCGVSVDGVVIHKRRYHQLDTGYKPVPFINLPDVHEAHQHLVENFKPVDLMGVNLDDVQHLNYLLKRSVESDYGQYSDRIESVSIATICVYVIVFLCISYVSYLRFKDIVIKKLGREQVQDDQDENQPQPPILLVTR